MSVPPAFSNHSAQPLGWGGFQDVKTNRKEDIERSAAEFIENTTYDPSTRIRKREESKTTYPSGFSKEVLSRDLEITNQLDHLGLRYLGWCCRGEFELTKDLKKAAELYEASLKKEETAEVAEELYGLYREEAAKSGQFCVKDNKETGAFDVSWQQQIFPSEEDYIRLLKICIEKGDDGYKARAMEELGGIYCSQQNYMKSLRYYADAANVRGDGLGEPLSEGHQDVLKKLHFSGFLCKRYQEDMTKRKDILRDVSIMKKHPTITSNRFKDELDEWAAACARLVALGDNDAARELGEMVNTINNHMGLTVQERREFIETLNKHRPYYGWCTIS